jgi:hypothetical protein
MFSALVAIRSAGVTSGHPLEEVGQDACLVVGEPPGRIGRVERGDLLQDIAVSALRCHLPDPPGVSSVMTGVLKTPDHAPSS